MTDRKRPFLTLGRIIGPFGLKGELRFRPYNFSSDTIFSLDSIILRDASGKECILELRSARRWKGIVILGIGDINTREEAERYKGNEVWIPRESLPPLKGDEYYWYDLIGMEVYGPGNEMIGMVERIISRPENDILVLRDQEGGECLIPLIKTIIESIDLKAERLLLKTTEGIWKE